MKKSLLIVVVPLILIALSMIGIGFSFVASFESDNAIGADYCSVSVSGGEIDSIVVVQSGSSFYLGFESNGIESQTLPLKYNHTRGTDLVLTIEFSCTVNTEAPIISCFSDEIVVGSTTLTGEGTKSGAISGIILPVNKNGIGTIDFTFQVKEIDAGKPVQISLSVHPLEASS